MRLNHVNTRYMCHVFSHMKAIYTQDILHAFYLFKPCEICLWTGLRVPN